MKKFWKEIGSAHSEARHTCGKAVAALAMALAVAVGSASTLTLLADQPAGLTVEPAAVQQAKPEKKARKKAEKAAAASAAADAVDTAETPLDAGETAEQTEAPAAAQPEKAEDAPQTPAEQPAQEVDNAPAVTETAQPEAENAEAEEIEAENSPVILQQETPELAAEDPLAAPVSTTDTEENDTSGHTPEGTMLLTPEEIREALDSGALEEAQAQCIDLSDENGFFTWLWNWLFGKTETPEPVYSGWRTEGGKTYYYSQTTNKKVTGIQSIDKKLYYFDANGVLQNDVTFGVDVSKYQTNVDWKEVKKAGVKFVIIRIGYRGYGNGALVLDPMFEEHFTNARNAGLKVGVYFFTQAVNEDEAREEAQGCAYVLNGRKLDYPIYYDTEASGSSKGTGRADGLGVTDRTNCAIAFCEEVKALGYKPGVYASTTWYRKRIDLASLRKYTIWNAHYGVSSSPIDCDMWQGTEKGRISGYNGEIDVNISYMG